MDYADIKDLLNRCVFGGDKLSLLEKIARSPERYVGLFRPTKPKAKILQNLLQSHEIRFGGALEKLTRVVLGDGLGFQNLPLSIETNNGEVLELDQFFTDGSTYYFVEQKTRDDHDSSKKRGDIENFERKLEWLAGRHDDLVGILYFMDPAFSKNKAYYARQLRELESTYEVALHLLYGGELFEYLGHADRWSDVIAWLERWRRELPDLPEVNLDLTPQSSFEEVRDLKSMHWRRLLQNDQIWEDGVMAVLFPRGETLRLILGWFSGKERPPYPALARMLETRLREHYEET